jgi:hypothetical protein
LAPAQLRSRRAKKAQTLDRSASIRAADNRRATLPTHKRELKA